MGILWQVREKPSPRGAFILKRKTDTKQLGTQYIILLQLWLFIGKKYTGFIWTETNKTAKAPELIWALKKALKRRSLWLSYAYKGDTRQESETTEQLSLAFTKGKGMEENENKYKWQEQSEGTK